MAGCHFHAVDTVSKVGLYLDYRVPEKMKQMSSDFWKVIPVCFLSLLSIGIGGCKKDPIRNNFEYTVSLGQAAEINQSWLPSSGFYPDGGFSIIEVGNSYALFWPSFETSRSVGNSPFPEDHSATNLNPATPVFGYNELDNGSSNGFDDGGSWIYGVHTLDGSDVVGFYHAESHWYPRTTFGITAYKTIAITYSNDYGTTWQYGVPIITHELPKPVDPEWTGVGDFCVLYNNELNAWICYYSSDGWLHMAMSEDACMTSAKSVLLKG